MCILAAYLIILTSTYKYFGFAPFQCYEDYPSSCEAADNKSSSLSFISHHRCTCYWVNQKVLIIKVTQTLWTFRVWFWTPCAAERCFCFTVDFRNIIFDHPPAGCLPLQNKVFSFNREHVYLPEMREYWQKTEEELWGAVTFLRSLPPVPASAYTSKHPSLHLSLKKIFFPAIHVVYNYVQTGKGFDFIFFSHLKCTIYWPETMKY